MGLLNARNLRKAKELLEKNRHKVGDVVEKAGTQLDKVSKGKTSNVTSKAADAAKKYSTGGVTHHGVDTPPPPPPPGQTGSDQTQRQADAAGAVTGAANAFTNFLNKAAQKVEQSSSKDQSSRTQTADSWPAPTEKAARDDADAG